jgi:hypothetical protein
MITPRLVSAQRRGTSRVGVLDPNPGPRQSTLAAIHEGLEDAGFSSFGLVSIEYRWAGWTDSRFNPLIPRLRLPPLWSVCNFEHDLSGLVGCAIQHAVSDLRVCELENLADRQV